MGLVDSEISHVLSYGGNRYYIEGFDSDYHVITHGPATYFHIVLLDGNRDIRNPPANVVSAARQFLNNGGFADMTLTEYIQSLGL
jgi:hypothetical protein